MADELRDSIVALIRDLQRLGHKRRTAAMDRLLSNLLRAVDDYDSDQGTPKWPKA